MITLRHLVFLLLMLPNLAVAVQQYTYRVGERLPQSRENFTQGLQIIDDSLYVSTGTNGQSHLLHYSFPQGELLQSRKLHSRIFAEGVTVLGDKIYQLTWKNRKLLVYAREEMQPHHSVALPGEGWGMTTNGEHLIYGDGSDKLHFLSPKTGEVQRSIAVTEHGQALRQLNELEWVEGRIWANVWRTNRIVIIDPDSGEVLGNIDLSGLLPDNERRRGTDVLNGIARNPADGSIWVTGKRWPWLYRIEILPKETDLP